MNINGDIRFVVHKLLRLFGLLLLVSLPAWLAPPSISAATFFHDTFSPQQAGWSFTSPSPDFMGELNDNENVGEVTLTITLPYDVPKASLEFDLYGFGSLDGFGTCCTDTLTMSINGNTAFTGAWSDTSQFNGFATNPSGATYTEIFAGVVGAHGASSEHHFKVPHTLHQGTNVYSWSYTSLQPLFDEAWGLDDVIIKGESGILLAADVDKLWANGHAQAKLTVTGSPGKTVALTADPSTKVKIDPQNATLVDPTGGNIGKAEFTVTSTQVAQTKFTATDTADSSITADKTINFQRHKVVIRFLGIDTHLTCAGVTCDPGIESNNFALLSALLTTSYGFHTDDLLWFSYRGGDIDTTSGVWHPRNYRCQDTAQDYQTDLIALKFQLESFSINNPNTDFYLVGHSQGGLIAFQAVGIPFKLKSGAIKGIVTLDSPLGGTPNIPTQIASIKSCWGGAAKNEIIQLYNTVPNGSRDKQGSIAQLLCSLPSIAMCNYDFNQHAAKAIPTATFGSFEDAVYHPSECSVQNPNVNQKIWNKTLASFGSNTNTQIIERNVGGGLSDLYNNIPRDKITDFADCAANSHKISFLLLSGNVANIIASQYENTPFTRSNYNWE